MRILGSATTALRRIVDLGLVLLIVTVLLGVVLGKGAPLVGRQSIVIGGSSMEPAIPLGAAIVVQPADPATLAVGDIVSMQIGPERTTFTHRVVTVIDRADGRWIRTQGDANAEPDPTLVAASAVIGRVELVIPYAGYLLALLSLPMGVMFVLGFAATLLAIAWLLESLEPDPRPRRARSEGPVVDGGSTSSSPATAQPAPDGALLRGEPIAARPTWAPLPSAPTLVPAGAGGSLGVDRTTPSFVGPSPVDGCVSRPTVREQLDRSREVRRKRARWQAGRDPKPAG
jgi:signal peptidase